MDDVNVLAQKFLEEQGLCHYYYRMGSKRSAYIHASFAIECMMVLLQKDDDPINREDYQQQLAKLEKAQKRLFYYMAQNAELLPNMLSKDHPLHSSLAKHQINEKDIEIFYTESIGTKGMEGKIFNCTYKGTLCVIKIYLPIKEVHPKRSDRLIVDDLYRSLCLRHPCIIDYYGFVHTRMNVGGINCKYGIVMRKATDDLKQQLSKKCMDDDTKKRIFMQVLHGVTYLHANGILYSDLKPDNILIFTNSRGQLCANLCDFGLSKEIKIIEGFEDDLVTYEGSTENYKSPEIANNKIRVSFKSDIYSLASLAYQMVTGLIPYTYPPGINPTEQISKGKSPTFPQVVVDPFWKHIFDRCWQKVPDRRPTAAELLNELRVFFH